MVEATLPSAQNAQAPAAHQDSTKRKAFIKDGIEQFLKRCEKCGKAKYLATNESLCEANEKKLKRTSR
jgi:hypothetical protein